MGAHVFTFTGTARDLFVVINSQKSVTNLWSADRPRRQQMTDCSGCVWSSSGPWVNPEHNRQPEQSPAGRGFSALGHMSPAQAVQPALPLAPLEGISFSHFVLM